MELNRTLKQVRTFVFIRTCLTICAVCLAVLAVTGCETSIPATDTQPPDIRLTITGPGIGRQEMTNPPREIWTGPEGVQLFDLAPNTEYQFLLTVTDEGGVARANLRMPESFTVVSLSPGDTIQEVVALGLSRSLTLRGTQRTHSRRW